ncbi:MAG TPA: ATP-grasp domain-containing protein [Polyangiaceae bacterium]
MTGPIVLLFGGTSDERLVSVASAQNVAATRPDAEPWFLTPEGAVVRAAREALLAHERPFERAFGVEREPEWESLERALDAAPCDAVFVLALHGGDGENGVVQRALEERGLAFTGSGSLASALAFDKARAKEAVARAGVRTPSALVLAGAEGDVARALQASFGARGRLVVKPVASGSSVSLFHLREAREIEGIARHVAAAGVPFLAEDFVSGVELTIGVVDERAGLAALPPSEVRLEAGAAFDYAGKYLGRGVVEVTPAQVATDVAAAAQEAALAAHRATGCEGYSRTDVIAGEGGVTFLEINTLPGLTKASFVPQQLAASGRTLGGFLERQIEVARRRSGASEPGRKG